MNLACQKPLGQITKEVGLGLTPPPRFFQNFHIFRFFLWQTSFVHIIHGYLINTIYGLQQEWKTECFWSGPCQVRLKQAPQYLLSFLTNVNTETVSKGPLFFILWLFISWWKEAAFLSTDTFLQPPSFSVGGEPVGNAIKTLRFLPLAASPIIAYQRAKNRPKKSEEGNNCSMSAWLCRRRMGLKFDKERVSTRLASIRRRLALVITV